MKNPMDLFFSLGEKVTGGDPKRVADFNYAMLWIIFGAFAMIFFGNIWNFITTYELHYLGWSAFAIAIMWFQYNALKSQRDMRKMIKNVKPGKKEMKIESEEEMLKEFEKEVKDVS